jgi:hypothetical protein
MTTSTNRTHVIELPSSLKVHSIGNLLQSCEFFPVVPPTQFVLRFHPRYSQFEPFALAMLAAWAQFWANQSVPVTCENLSAKGVAYAQRLGLFKFIAAALPRVVAHEEAGRFAELQHIHRQADLTKLIGDLGGILRAPELIETVQYLVAEMTRNVLEHAGANAFVCVQHYRKAGRVSLGIADCGRGVLDSLRRAHDFKTHEDAIVGALRPGVTGVVPMPYGSPDNAGLGLFYARGLAKWTAQYFLLVTGDSGYRLKRRQATRAPARDPRADGHDLYGGHGWRGTVVAIDIASVGDKHGEMFKAIGAAASPRDELRETKSRIRFT